MTGSGGATVLDDLPESIVVEEILLRLPPKDLLRCRAVRKCWHSATFTDKFMLDHHRRQPLLPILSHGFWHALDQQEARLFASRDAGAGQQQLCPFLRYSRNGRLHAALDGLLVVSEGPDYFICNPVTRKCAPLRMPQSQEEDFHNGTAGFYWHQPSGEYRVLWVTSTKMDPVDSNYTTYYYVVAVGSDNPRCVRQGYIPHRTASTPLLEVVLRTGLPSSSNDPPVHHRGSLHWKLGTSCIVVFDTTTEVFRLMRSPVTLHARESLLEMGGALAFCSISSNRDTVDIWVMQDYDAEIWSFKRRINLLVVDPPSPLDSPKTMFPKMAVLNQGDQLLIQFSFGPVLRYDIHGKFLGYVKSEDGRNIYLRITRHYLQESVTPLPLYIPWDERRRQAFVFRRAIGCSA